MLARAAPLVLFGAGKMGGAMLEAWLNRGLDAASVTIIDPGLPVDRAEAWRKRGVRVFAAVEGPDSEPPRTLVLAVKPQSIDEALAPAARLAGPETLILSVAAGIRLERLAEGFGATQPIIRIMPNTPAQVGAGMSVACASAAADAGDRELVDALLAAIGLVDWVEDEDLMDAVTAVSGSGPAYVFLLSEALARAGQAAGLPAALAERLARQTVVGGGALLAASSEPAARLRENVTSPGGTTAAALSVLMGENRLQDLLTEAVIAARDRSIALR
ncbi:MAG TPA: pyrroline-5-carboxylate reductase [Afifellaceae bacterium]|nr:pyrroline-5-carboxylate reductase [Afifellaceae bacterium]